MIKDDLLDNVSLVAAVQLGPGCERFLIQVNYFLSLVLLGFFLRTPHDFSRLINSLLFLLLFIK
jgi:hypothetical protein